MPLFRFTEMGARCLLPCVDRPPSWLAFLKAQGGIDGQIFQDLLLTVGLVDFHTVHFCHLTQPEMLFVGQTPEVAAAGYEPMLIARSSTQFNTSSNRVAIAFDAGETGSIPGR